MKGTIHWVSAAQAVQAEVRLYENLFTVSDPSDVPEGVEHFAAVGPTGELVGILKIHSSGAFRLRPNFFGLG